MRSVIRQWMSDRSVLGLDLDDPDTTRHHAEMIRRKPILRDFYEKVYDFFAAEAKSLPQGTQVELGSGGGFLKDRLPQVVTSDVLPLPNVDLCFSALDMPFEDETVAAIYMLDVLHHIPDAGLFLEEATRCLVPGGKVVMVEPANTWFGRLIYRNFHHEPFEPDVRDWKLPEGGPMSVANGALPWIIFERDRTDFETANPHLAINQVRYWAPFRYLASGGVSMRQLIPTALYPAVVAAEWLTTPVHDRLGMFMRIVVQKRARHGRSRI